MPVDKKAIAKMRRQFAHLIGGVDNEGVEHKLAQDERGRERKRAAQLFAVLAFEKENPHWEFVDGRRVGEFINTGRYEVQHMGENRGNLLANKKVRKKMEQQIHQLIQAKKAKDDRAAVFRDDGYYDELLQEELEKFHLRVKAFEESEDKKKEKV